MTKKENEILEILTEELPYKDNTSSGSMEHTKHLHHVASRINKVIEKLTSSRLNNEKTYMRVIKCLDEGKCTTDKINEIKKKGRLQYAIKKEKKRGPYVNAKHLTIHTNIDIWEEEEK